jgi:hypothetical protein
MRHMSLSPARYQSERHRGSITKETGHYDMAKSQLQFALIQDNARLSTVLFAQLLSGVI